MKKMKVNRKNVKKVSVSIIAAARRKANKMENRQSAGAKMWGAFKKANAMRKEFGLPPVHSKNVKSKKSNSIAV